MKRHNPFHLVNQRPWPLLASILAFDLVASTRILIHRKIRYTLLITQVLLFITAWNWWQDVHRERTSEGWHSSEVKDGLKLGMLLFISSEVFFFLAFFWSFFHRRLSKTPEIGQSWPPLLIEPFNPMRIPLLNTTVLLFSGASITWSHHSIEENSSSSTPSLLTTIILGVLFTVLQWIEYKEAPFSISDSIYGSRFFIATGFHGLHVIIGSVFLTISLIRNVQPSFNNKSLVGFECSAWYWHFVDVVWLFLYSFIYWWSFYFQQWQVTSNFQLESLRNNISRKAWLITSTIFIISRIMLTLTKTVRKKKKTSPQKTDSFECGIWEDSPSKLPFSTQYFMILILFLIFDVELVILIPFSIEKKIYINKTITLGIILILILGTIYEWKKGTLDWSKWMDKPSIRLACLQQAKQSTNLKKREFRILKRKNITPIGINKT